MNGCVYQAFGMWGKSKELMTADEVRQWCRRHNLQWALSPTRPDQFRLERLDGLHLNDHEKLLFSSLNAQSAGGVSRAAPGDPADAAVSTPAAAQR